MTKKLVNLNFFSEYKIYIKNRPKVGANNPRGGVGVMVYQPTPHQILNLNTELEAIAVNYKYNNKTISACSLYLMDSQPYTIEQLTNLTDQLNEHHLILGDFNAHHNIWGVRSK